MNQVTMQDISFLAIIFVGSIVLFVFAWVWRKNNEVALRQFADKLGLAFEPGILFISSPRLSGLYKGYPFRLEYVVKRTISSSSNYTHVVVKVENKENAYLRLSKTWLNNGKLFPEFEIGDEEFDRRVMMLDQPADFGKKVLASKILRQRLLRLRSFYIVLDKQDLLFRHSGYIADTEYLQKVFEVMYMLAYSIRAAQSEVAPIDFEPVQGD